MATPSSQFPQRTHPGYPAFGGNLILPQLQTRELPFSPWPASGHGRWCRLDRWPHCSVILPETSWYKQGRKSLFRRVEKLWAASLFTQGEWVCEHGCTHRGASRAEGTLTASEALASATSVPCSSLVRLNPFCFSWWCGWNCVLYAEVISPQCDLIWK